uniref:FAD/NAD(P)-binding domain-containing protein n=1 Tax=Bionectria ochroleuca TaxID=29856 RepID=A0A8H7N5X1_BIOOC
MEQDPEQHREFTKSSVVIVGGGFSGMCMAIKLLEAGTRDLIIVEKSTGFGGTWKDNSYPGCCCDVLSTLYSYSFEQNPNWSRRYPAQGEILDYVREVATKYKLYSFVRFCSEVTEATWDKASKEWNVSVRVLSNKEAEACNSYTIQTKFFISGVGQLTQPYWPQIPGQERFHGKIMHAARWDWSYDLKGKRIAIIGNGAAAVQIAPEVAKVASQLTIFQRTPKWVISRLDDEVQEWKRGLLRNVPFLLPKIRALIMDRNEGTYESLIRRGSAESAELTKESIAFLHSELPDRPDLWEVLTPKYAPGCKRILITDDYYKTLRLPHVALETRGIGTITEKGIHVGIPKPEEGESLGFDLIVFATGFQTQEFLQGIDVRGVDGRSLGDIWEKGARALYGMTVESLPNFGILYGPNTNLGHNSIILMIEAQARYLLTIVKEVLKSAQRGQGLAITPRPERLREWNANLQKELDKTTFADPLCSSWYKNKDGHITNNWSGTVVDYQKLLSKLDWSDFDLEEDDSGSSSLPSGAVAIGRVVEESLVGPQAMIGGISVGALAALSYLVYRNRRRIPLLG